jgi:hypothetical protein
MDAIASPSRSYAIPNSKSNMLLWILAGLLLLINTLFPTLSIAADQQGKTRAKTLRFVVILDRSGSMLTSADDPSPLPNGKRNRTERAREMILAKAAEIENYPGFEKFEFVLNGFDAVCEPVYTRPHTPGTSFKDHVANELKRTESQWVGQYKPNTGTNLVAAFDQASAILKAKRDPNVSTLLGVITDGQQNMDLKGYGLPLLTENGKYVPDKFGEWILTPEAKQYADKVVADALAKLAGELKLTNDQMLLGFFNVVPIEIPDDFKKWVQDIKVDALKVSVNKIKLAEHIEYKPVGGNDPDAFQATLKFNIQTSGPIGQVLLKYSILNSQTQYQQVLTVEPSKGPDHDPTIYFSKKDLSLNLPATIQLAVETIQPAPGAQAAQIEGLRNASTAPLLLAGTPQVLVSKPAGPPHVFNVGFDDLSVANDSPSMPIDLVWNDKAVETGGTLQFEPDSNLAAAGMQLQATPKSLDLNPSHNGKIQLILRGKSQFGYPTPKLITLGKITYKPKSPTTTELSFPIQAHVSMGPPSIDVFPGPYHNYFILPENPSAKSTDKTRIVPIATIVPQPGADALDKASVQVALMTPDAGTLVSQDGSGFVIAADGQSALLQFKGNTPATIYLKHPARPGINKVDIAVTTLENLVRIRSADSPVQQQFLWLHTGVSVPHLKTERIDGLTRGAITAVRGETLDPLEYRISTQSLVPGLTVSIERDLKSAANAQNVANTTNTLQVGSGGFAQITLPVSTSSNGTVPARQYPITLDADLIDPQIKEKFSEYLRASIDVPSISIRDEILTIVPNASHSNKLPPKLGIGMSDTVSLPLPSDVDAFISKWHQKFPQLSLKITSSNPNFKITFVDGRDTASLKAFLAQPKLIITPLVNAKNRECLTPLFELLPGEENRRVPVGMKIQIDGEICYLVPPPPPLWCAGAGVILLLLLGAGIYWVKRGKAPTTGSDAPHSASTTENSRSSASLQAGTVNTGEIPNANAASRTLTHSTTESGSENVNTDIDSVEPANPAPPPADSNSHSSEEGGPA